MDTPRSSPATALTASGAAAGAGHNQLHLAPGGGVAAAGIDLAARLASALGVTIADLLPMPSSPVEEFSVLRENAKRLFDSLLQREDRAVLLLLTQLLARLSEATNR